MIVIDLLGAEVKAELVSLSISNSISFWCGRLAQPE
jgi:hypothetical protein